MAKALTDFGIRMAQRAGCADKEGPQAVATLTFFGIYFLRQLAKNLLFFLKN